MHNSTIGLHEQRDISCTARWVVQWSQGDGMPQGQASHDHTDLGEPDYGTVRPRGRMDVGGSIACTEQHLLYCCSILYCVYRLCVRIRVHTL